MSVLVRATRLAIKLAKKRAARKKYAKIYKSVNPYNIKAKTDIRWKDKQKPKHPGGGREAQTQTGTHYGLRGTELKVGTKMARASMWHDTRAKGSESWRNEMIRVFGGIHMSQTKEGAKKSVQILAKDYKKRFKKKKVKKLLAGGLLYPGIRLAVKYSRPLWKAASKKVYDRAGKTAMSKLQIKLDKARDLQSHFSKKQLKDLTSAKIKEMGEILPKLKAYKTKIKDTAKAWLEKEYRFGKKKKILHSEGGEVVIGKNVDKSLL
jgi:hypothetical protein